MRSQKRAGYGNLRGATNKRITTSANEPKSPQSEDLWIDASYDPPLLKRYDAAAVTWKNIVNYGVTDVDFYTDGFYVTYDDGVQHEWTYTKDGSGQITNLTNDDTSRSIDITWNATTKPT